MSTPTPSKPRGRPSKPLSERKHAVSIYIHPKELTFLNDLGEGSVSRGVSRAIGMLEHHKAAAFEAIRAAAARRDQTQVSGSPPPFASDGSTAFD